MIAVFLIHFLHTVEKDNTQIKALSQRRTFSGQKESVIWMRRHQGYSALDSRDVFDFNEVSSSVLKEFAWSIDTVK